MKKDRPPAVFLLCSARENKSGPLLMHDVE